MRVHDLLVQNVGLVEEQYDGGTLKPGVSDDGFKQSFALLHTVLKEAFKYYRKKVLEMFYRTPNCPSTTLTSLSHSARTWSYSLSATRKIMEVTFSKQWIHFLLSDL